jgi:hypothetical protein
MPAAADVQTQNGGKKAAKPETGDSITFTFAGPVVTTLVLAGWDGSATAVTLHFQNNAKNDVLSVRTPTGTTIAALGSVTLGGDYSETADFTNSTMTASGNTIRIVLGTLSGKVKDKPKAATMVWTAPTNSILESGVLDKEF